MGARNSALEHALQHSCRAGARTRARLALLALDELAPLPVVFGGAAKPRSPRIPKSGQLRDGLAQLTQLHKQVGLARVSRRVVDLTSPEVPARQQWVAQQSKAAQLAQRYDAAVAHAKTLVAGSCGPWPEAAATVSQLVR